MYISLHKSSRKDKKYEAIFYTVNDDVLCRVHFGHPLYEDYTIHKDQDRKKRYLQRFNKLIKAKEKDPFAPITLSTMLLWNKPTLKESLKDYLERFKIKYSFD